MNDIERIRNSIKFEEEMEKIKSAEFINQDGCSHILFVYYGCKPISDEITRCLLCNKDLGDIPYKIAETMPKVFADISKCNLNPMDVDNYEFSELLFFYSQNKFLELSEMYPEKDSIEIVEMLNEILDEILKNGNQEEIMQRLNEYLQAEEKPLELKKVDTPTQQK